MVELLADTPIRDSVQNEIGKLDDAIFAALSQDTWGASRGGMKRIIEGHETKMFDELMFIANSISVSDPIGAAKIRDAAWLLVKAGCLRCKMEYQRGYAAGYKAGMLEAAI